ncbi:hypothetical protein ACFPVX_02730 [Cohnella faecalis]|uniref:hypothetical protein n=1 Tax=Cohnella faecalis TaxID=2315694 RepID=UPI0013141E92|nr:hypothetical protein [Cohnella faecalis]
MSSSDSWVTYACDHSRSCFLPQYYYSYDEKKRTCIYTTGTYTVSCGEYSQGGCCA